jgi:formate transporter
MMGAKFSVADWWIWDRIPVTLGNLVASFVFTGLAIYLPHKPREAASKPLGAPMGVPAE